MKRLAQAAIFSTFLALTPGFLQAETRVYVSFSIGGAVVVGGGILFWSFNYSQRVSQNAPKTDDRLTLTGSNWASNRLYPETSYAVTDQDRPASIPPLSFEFPLLLYRW